MSEENKQKLVETLKKYGAALGGDAEKLADDIISGRVKAAGTKEEETPLSENLRGLKGKPLQEAMEEKEEKKE